MDTARFLLAMYMISRISMQFLLYTTPIYPIVAIIRLLNDNAYGYVEASEGFYE